jgi:hypothetical protein
MGGYFLDSRGRSPFGMNHWPANPFPDHTCRSIFLRTSRTRPNPNFEWLAAVKG